MNWSSVATYDQKLTLNGVILDGYEKTLAELNVLPGSLIELRVSNKFLETLTTPHSLKISFKVPFRVCFCLSCPELFVLWNSL